MNKNKMLDFFTVIFHKIKKHGFTLAEALIAIVMTGYALLPILGTMQNAADKTQKFDHRSKMVQYTRSRLNAEIANAAFDHRGINTKTAYHYRVLFATDSVEAHAKFKDLTNTDIASATLAKLHKPSGGNEKVDHSDSDVKRIKKLLEIGENDSFEHCWLTLVYAYKTRVEVIDHPSIASASSNANDTVSGTPAPKSLLALSVTTTLSEYGGVTYQDNGYPQDSSEDSEFIAPFSLFSFVNLPTVSDAYIWMADAYNIRILGLDPLSKSIATEIKLPRAPGFEEKPADSGNDSYRPWNLAVHPSLKFLAVQTGKSIYLVNIDRKSDKYGKCMEFLKLERVGDYYTNAVNKSPLDEALNEASKDRGLAFRPDGEYLFYTCEKEGGEGPFLKVSKVNYSIAEDVLQWNEEANQTPSLSGLSKKIYLQDIDSPLDSRSLIPANDGNLYIAVNDKRVFRVSMYPEDFSDLTLETFVWKNCGSKYHDYKIVSMAISPDGKRLFLLREGNRLEVFDTVGGKELCNQAFGDGLNLTQIVLALDSSSNLSSSRLLLHATDEKDGSGISVKKIAYNDFHKIITPSPGSITPQIRTGQPALAPLGDSLAFIDTKNDKVYFAPASSSAYAISSGNGDIVKYGGEAEGENSCSNLVTSPVEYLAAAYQKENDFGVSLYNLNTLKEIEDRGFNKLQSPLKGISMNPNADTLMGYYGSGKADLLKLYFGPSDSAPEKIDCSDSEKAAFDGSTPNTVFSLESKKNSDDAFWHVREAGHGIEMFWDSSSPAYVRKDFDISRDWKRLDMVTLPKGGALVLYGMESGNQAVDGASMLEWVGRMNWNSDPNKIGKYRLFARWVGLPAVEGCIKPAYNINVDGNTDTWAGRIAIDIEDSFPVGSVIESANCKAGSGFSDIRYITPIIVEKKGNGDFSNFEIKDWAIESIALKAGNFKKGVSINWKNGGKIINANYRLGFWHGNINGSHNRGAISYNQNSTGKFYADYYINEKDEEDVIPVGHIALDKLLKPYYENEGQANDNGYNRRRNYNIQFNTAKEKRSWIFPPLHSKKLAITQDQSMMAILSGKGGGTTEEKKPKISFYDFNNFNFDQETQVEGMLVDYRNPYVSGAWPRETTTRAFKKVQEDCSFLNKINSFHKATTRGESWKSYNTYPMNHSIYGTYGSLSSDELKKKVSGNKRFFGYFRPEIEIKALNGRTSGDVRFFLNKAYAYGRKEADFHKFEFMENNLVPQPPFDPHDSQLLQVDQSHVDIYSALSLFISSYEDAPTGYNKWGSPSYSYPHCVEEYENRYYNPHNDKWKNLLSSATCIFKFVPILMCSFDLVSATGLNNCSLAFSRNLHNPQLYILSSDTKQLWGFGASTQTPIAQNQNLNIDGDVTSNLVVSPDGQKLLFASKEKNSSNNVINAYHIKVNGKLENPESKEVKHKITSLAVKPFTSYSSNTRSGAYRTLFDNLEDEFKKVDTNTALTVASGGIYIYNSQDKKLFRYNPVTDSVISSLAKDLLPSAGSSMVAYDDCLYILGNGGDNNNPRSGRVQSYNIRTGEILDSIVPTEKEDDGEYWANTCALKYFNNGENTGNNKNYSDDLLTIIAEETEGGGGSYTNVAPNFAFDGKSDSGHYWRTGGMQGNDDNSKLYYETKIPFTVNKLSISNNIKGNGKSGVKDFEFYGMEGNEIKKLLVSGTVPKNTEEYEVSFSNSTPYKKYLFYAKSAYGSEDKRGITELKMYRRGLKSLTPTSSDGVSLVNNDPNVMKWEHEGKSITLRTSSVDGSVYQLKEIYENNYKSGYYNNPADGDGYSWSSQEDKPWIMASLSEAEAVQVVRFCNYEYDRGYVKKFSLFASNLENPSPTVLSGVWEPLIEKSGCPKICRTWLTYELDNNTKYKYYLFRIDDYASGTPSSFEPLRITGFELYAPSTSEVAMTADCLTSLVTDDLVEVKVGSGAACLTPYGIVYAGGCVADAISTSFAATATSLLYWPQAVNRYDGSFYNYGIPRSLPNLMKARFGHSLVWHKGKIYAIGGAVNQAYNLADGDNFVEFLEYNKELKWGAVDKAKFSCPNSSSNDNTIGQLRRYQAGVCSFGDEIFIFGGIGLSNQKLSTAYAWNPETGRFRKLKDLTESLAPCNAVAFGSKIYIYGMNNSGKARMYEYTP